MDYKSKRAETRQRNLIFRDLKRERRGQGAHKDKKKYSRPPRLNPREIDENIDSL